MNFFTWATSLELLYLGYYTWASSYELPSTSLELILHLKYFTWTTLLRLLHLDYFSHWLYFNCSILLSLSTSLVKFHLLHFNCTPTFLYHLDCVTLFNPLELIHLIYFTKTISLKVPQLNYFLNFFTWTTSFALFTFTHTLLELFHLNHFK